MSWIKGLFKATSTPHSLFIVVPRKTRTDSHAVFRRTHVVTEKVLREAGWTTSQKRNDGIGKWFEDTLSPNGRVVYSHESSGVNAELPSIEIEIFDVDASSQVIKDILWKIQVDLYQNFRGLIIKETIGPLQNK